MKNRGTRLKEQTQKKNQAEELGMLKDECDKFHEGLREKEDRINKL